MGFTRYWKINKQLDTEKFKKYSETCRMVCEAWKEEQISKGSLEAGIAGWDGYGDPIFTGTTVCFNGDASEQDLAHETFSIDIISQGSNFCKTARKPYDKQVEACLYLAEKFFGDSIEIRSDGDDRDSEIISFVVSFLRENMIDLILD